MGKQHKAIALISGGLDSMLAAKVILEQGVAVEGINFFTGFCVEGHTHAIRQKDKKKAKRNNALWVAEQLGIPLHFVDVVDEYKQVLFHPKHGYGANLNPCLDCKIFMVGKAFEWLENSDFDYDFIITGEVIGQRPKSQRKATMPVIAKESGAQDRLLRPLSAKNLPPSLPEIEGWVDREKLYNFSGRSRKPQIALAESFGFKEYSQPAGGCCFLTDASYSRKLADLWQSKGTREYDLDDIMLLKVGRHIRPQPHFKLIVAREEGEGRFLQGYRKQFIHLIPISHKGPFTLIDGELDQEELTLSAQIVARFSQGRDAEQVSVEIHTKSGQAQIVAVKPLASEDLPKEWYV